MSSFALTWNGREVTNPFGVVAFLLLWSALFIAYVLLAPLWLPASWALKRSGRKGFHRFNGRYFEIGFTSDAFKKVA
ncbi:hypothetical protein [Mycolicibacterium phlei]|uniref:hypothetical protein n=1 Tax=Mycolicibacterium phlei TaxID=1771 RepID=UPI0003031F98|nr:hypothetical protein [Mycolicibacterium phlei]MBF4194700.1 hypothetical protein [Mycolicibacterium phlei]